MSGVYMYGIDVSSYQGDFDFTPYKDQFVIIRAGYGTTVDEKAVRNMKECDRLNIPYGVYWYSYASNFVEAEKEAKTCLKVIKNRNIRVGVWLAMKDIDNYKQKYGITSPVIIGHICKLFCDEIEKAGYYTGIYSDVSWFGVKIKDCGKYNWWVSSYGLNNGNLNTDTSVMGVLQQYTSKPLNKNVMYVPLSTFIKRKRNIIVDFFQKFINRKRRGKSA